jgi:hypothetical protein
MSERDDFDRKITLQVMASCLPFIVGGELTARPRYRSFAERVADQIKEDIAAGKTADEVAAAAEDMIYTETYESDGL